MATKTILASDLIKDLQELIGEHGDLPMMIEIEDEGVFPIDRPRLDTDDAGDACFVV